MAFAPSIIAPTQIKSASPVFVLKDTNTVDGEYYFRIQIFGDAEMTKLIADINTLDNPELFEYSQDNGVTWYTLGNIPLNKGVLVRTKVNIGPRTKVWVRTGIGYYG